MVLAGVGLSIAAFSGAENASPRGGAKTCSTELVRGKRVKCERKFRLGRIQMTTPQEGWADGFFFPTVGEGSGDNTVLHTTDAGRTWAQVSVDGLVVDQHGSVGPDPLSFFADPLHGWIWWMDVPEATIRLARTQDGGRTWQTRETGVTQGRQLQFFDRLHGYALGFDIRGGSFLFTTEDGGETWARYAVPFEFTECASFVDPDVGYVVGSDKEGNLGAATTGDGGSSWAASSTPPLPRSVQVIDCTRSSAERGWLILWLLNDDGSQLLQTTDGGRHWSRHPEGSIQGPRRWLNCVRFMTETVGFAFVRSTGREGDDLFLTQDGGERWTKMRHLRSSVADCQLFQGELWCGAGMDVLEIRR
jgi:photosystem II stability/assembly factor-like uncharacterized protein